MNSSVILKIFSIIILCVVSAGLAAQSGLSLYTDFGNNNISQGIYLKTAISGYYKTGNTRIESGIQTDIKNENNYGFSGYCMSVSQTIKIKNLPIALSGFFNRLFPSDILVETNWGALINTRHNHVEVSLGTNFRTFGCREKTSAEYDPGYNRTRIHEIYNIMYAISYYLKPSDDNWNLGLTVTNVDHFCINQETNPVFRLSVTCKVSTPLRIYFQAWYKPSGVTNLELNHFGYFLRTGVVWNIN